ncbi:winged helix-turn-helix domain-containing protein [Paenibacillus caui]|uniref:winged helix-turn-helix domain-containing protein n=1 Tax=Paenibacillus caui TaxID=2873927 RepID=UPI001CA9CFFF|nr:winged helix-turn-helix domain-containing protein [Paenibacillus caui]
MGLQLDESEYKVYADGRVMELLPKEFALLQFLYTNRGITFNRAQLLDQVWPLEYPVERTVDDHIYRLRKKLRSIHGLEIRTVRGYGYSLAIQEPSAGSPTHPTIRDREVRDAMREIFCKYHQYGQGKSMLSLAEQQGALGYEMDPFYAIYVHFVQGDWDWLLNTEEVPLGERLYLLLLIFIFSGDPVKGIEFCEKALENKALSPFRHIEMEFLNIIELYAWTGQLDRAVERIGLGRRLFIGPEFANFLLPAAIMEMLVQLLAGKPDEELAMQAGRIENILSEKPYLREKGSYHIVKGLWFVTRGECSEGESLLDKGLDILDMSGFIPLRMHALNRLFHSFRILGCHGPMQLKYGRLLREEQRRQEMNRFGQPLEATLLNYLDSL